MDEDTAFEDAKSHMTVLQDHANMLEEHIETEKEEDHIVYVDKAWVRRNDDGTFSSFHRESCSETKNTLPEIEIKLQEKDVLIRVHCEKRNDYLRAIVGEIEKLHLSVENISTLPFGEHFLDITVTAKMGDADLTMKDLKRNLQQAVLCIL